METTLNHASSVICFYNTVVNVIPIGVAHCINLVNEVVYFTLSIASQNDFTTAKSA